MFEKVFKFKTQQVYFIYPFLHQVKLGKLLQRCVIFFSLKVTFQARKICIFLESIFLQNKNWLRMQDFVYKTWRLVRISVLIRTVTKSLRFFSGGLFYKSNLKNFFSFVCIAWYKHSRDWENSWQLCKPSTSSQVCITVSNSPNPSCVYIRLCKHGKRFLLLKYSHQQ